MVNGTMKPGHATADISMAEQDIYMQPDDQRSNDITYGYPGNNHDRRVLNITRTTNPTPESRVICVIKEDIP